MPLAKHPASRGNDCFGFSITLDCTRADRAALSGEKAGRGGGYATVFGEGELPCQGCSCFFHLSSTTLAGLFISRVNFI